MVITEPRSMTYYLVRKGAEPVALVASIDMAREIMFSQPPGYYIVDELQTEPLGSSNSARAERRSTRHPVERHGDGPRVRSGRTISSRRRVGRQPDPRRC